MPQVKMPDGQIVDMPDQLTPELATRLKALQSAQQPTQPQQPAYQRMPSFVEQMDAMQRPFDPVAAGEQLGAGVTDLSTQLGASAPVAAGLGTAADVGVQAIPMAIGGSVASKASPALDFMSQKLMQSAIKPGLDELKSGEAATAIDTMLQEGIGMTKTGIQKLRDKISSVNDEIKSLISDSTEKVSLRKDVYPPLKEKLDQFKLQVNPEADLAALRKSWAEFKNHPLLGGQDSIPVQLAQELKQGTYKQVGGKNYGELSSASTEAQKTIARGLKEGISSKVPEIQGLNEKESKLLTTLNVTEKRVLLEANKNPMGFSILAQNPKMMALYMADKSSAFKGLLAKILYNNKEAIPAGMGSVGMGSIQTAEADRARRKNERAANGTQSPNN
jgi:hypothetical protein